MAPPRKIHVHFHIGYEKTGTTSIQTCLRANEGRLAEAGILYPRALGNISQYKVIVYCLKKPSRPVAGNGERPNHEELAGIRQQLAAEIEESGCDTVIVSSEHVSTQFRTAAHFARFKSLFRDFDARFTAIVYLREQVAFLESRSFTALAAGAPRIPPASARNAPDFLYYSRMLGLIEDAFGRDHVRVRLFQRSSLDGGDAVMDFLALVGAPGGLGVEAEPQNQSMGVNGMKALALLNSAIGNEDRATAHRIRKAAIAILRGLDTGPRYRIEAAAAEGLQAVFADDNRAVAQRYFGRDQLFEAAAVRAAEARPASRQAGSEAALLLAKIAAELWKTGRPAAKRLKSQE